MCEHCSFTVNSLWSAACSGGRLHYLLVVSKVNTSTHGLCKSGLCSPFYTGQKTPLTSGFCLQWELLQSTFTQQWWKRDIQVNTIILLYLVYMLTWHQLGLDGHWTSGRWLIRGHKGLCTYWFFTCREKRATAISSLCRARCNTGKTASWGSLSVSGVSVALNMTHPGQQKQKSKSHNCQYERTQSPF